MPDFDLVICVTERDIPILGTAMPYMVRFICPTRIVILSPTHCQPLLAPLGEKYHGKVPITLLDEEEVSEGLNLHYIQALMKARGADIARSGWYLQQFLKLCYALNPVASRYYLVWDADTIPLRPINFFDDKGQVIFDTSKEYNEAYFSTMMRLVGLGKTFEHSFISEHMMMETDRVHDLLERICSPDSVSGKAVAERVISAVGTDALSFSGFSEFETYGTFVMSFFPSTHRARALPYLRKGGMFFGRHPSSEELFVLSKHYYWASFEAWPRSTFRSKLYHITAFLIGAIWTTVVVLFYKKEYRCFVSP